MTKENTWRALKDLKPIQSLRCRVGWHRWTNYDIREQALADLQRARYRQLAKNREKIKQIRKEHKR